MFSSDRNSNSRGSFQIVLFFLITLFSVFRFGYFSIVWTEFAHIYIYIYIYIYIGAIYFGPVVKICYTFHNIISTLKSAR